MVFELYIILYIIILYIILHIFRLYYTALLYILLSRCAAARNPPPCSLKGGIHFLCGEVRVSTSCSEGRWGLILDIVLVLGVHY